MAKTDTKPTKSKVATKAKSPAKKSSGGGKNAEQVIMEALATFLVRGNEAPERTRVTSATKLAAKTIANALTKLKRSNFVEVDGKTIRLTNEGIKFLGPLAEKGGSGQTDEEVHENLKESMKKKEAELFDALVDGKVHDKNDVALELSYKDGKKTKAFMNLTGTMKTNCIVHYPAKDTIQLVRETCFPFGPGNSD